MEGLCNQWNTSLWALWNRKGGREAEKIHPWPINSNYLSVFLSCRCCLGKRGPKKGSRSRCNMYKGERQAGTSTHREKAGPFHTHPALIWIMVLVLLLPGPFPSKKNIAMHCVTLKLNLDRVRDKVRWMQCSLSVHAGILLGHLDEDLTQECVRITYTGTKKHNTQVSVGTSFKRV